MARREGEIEKAVEEFRSTMNRANGNIIDLSSVRADGTTVLSDRDRSMVVVNAAGVVESMSQAGVEIQRDIIGSGSPVFNRAAMDRYLAENPEIANELDRMNAIVPTRTPDGRTISMEIDEDNSYRGR
ncbi:MAG: hypothetical protein ACOYJ2_00050 [Rickettsiales bacterium]